jgi:ABC-type transport system involved in cytochrome c biogenesis permease component
MADTHGEKGGGLPTGSRGLWAVIVVLLALPVVVPLIVPLYDKVDPRLGGFPFFFWFQFALIVFSAGMTVLAFYLSKVAARRGDRW